MMDSNTTLYLWYVEKLSPQDSRLAAFTEHMGVSVTTISSIDEIRDSDDPVRLAVSAASLTPSTSDALTLFITRKPNRAVKLFVSDCQDPGAVPALNRIASTKIEDINREEFTQAQFDFPTDAQKFNCSLSGQGYSTSKVASRSTFVLGSNDVDIIMQLDKKPTFVRNSHEGCEFFLSSLPIADLDETIVLHAEPNYFEQVIPALIYLRHAFGERCWHNPHPSGRLIIDDPLIRKRYGLLDMSKLIESMAHSNYGTTIAFIPWNYRRTSRCNAKRLLNDDTNLSICVHGCDHTNKEFESQNSTTLSARAELAIQRMETQSERTKSSYEKVMVFPQGKFTRRAMIALRAHGYLAAINKNCRPMDNLDDFSVRDLVSAAVTKHGGIPLFHRRLPRDLFGFAFDLLVGKPVLIYEHHGFFDDGCAEISRVAEELNRMEPMLQWPSLSQQLEQMCLIRKNGDGSTKLRFYTRKFRLKNNAAEPHTYFIQKHEPDESTVNRVLADGARVDFAFEDNYLKLELSMEPLEEKCIEIVGTEQVLKTPNFGFKHNSKVLARRGLSEFRDGVLSRQAWLFKFGRVVARAFGLTWDS